MSSPAGQPKAPLINGNMAHALYAGGGAGAVTYAVSMETGVSLQAAAIGAVSSYFVNAVIPGTMTILPHDTAAALLTGGIVYYLSGNLTHAMGAFIGTNNTPTIAAFMKMPSQF